MADLTADAQLRLLGEACTEKWPLDTNAGFTVYKGQPLMLVVGTDENHAVPFVTALVVDPLDICLGIAAEQKTVVAGAPETTLIEVYVWPSIIGFKSAVYTDVDLGKPIYMSDSGTLSSTIGDNANIGTLFKVQDGYAFVALDTPKLCTGA
jgi:hypothetical protein